ncbi:MAG: YraN family protein, partial [Deinococcota bacterium]|nr:YraN family protein [Deinococcota bacterium]
MAKSYLEGCGYTIVAQNYRLRGGELDLVAQAGETLVFVEVKQRKSDRYGSAAEAIGPAKVARLRRAALFYLIKHYG